MAKPELLDPCTTVLDDDIVIITHASGLTERISGSDLKSVMRSGNAASATKWVNARNINGLSIDGQDNRVNYGTCSTAAATTSKTCDCAGFALIIGSEITVKFSVTNTATDPTLNVNSTGAKPIYYRGSAITPGLLEENRTYTFRYNGTQYELIGEALLNATSSAAGLMSSADKSKLDGIASDINTQVAAKVASSAIGAANGVAGLDSAGKVPSNQLPSYVDDVLEYADTSSFPATGETGKIYVAKDTNKSYRWSGSTYVELSSYAEATTSASGLMSASDKTKLNELDNYVRGYNYDATKLDFNEFTKTGFYRIGNVSNYSNAPSGAASYGQLIVIKNGDTIYQQYAGFNNNAKIFSRCFNDGETGGLTWQTFITESLLNAALLSKQNIQSFTTPANKKMKLTFSHTGSIFAVKITVQGSSGASYGSLHWQGYGPGTYDSIGEIVKGNAFNYTKSDNKIEVVLPSVSTGFNCCIENIINGEAVTYTMEEVTE
ncbi:MAG: hypothetical protein J6S67_21190 [Methanobrevibacter sp.]|nr:hypothetical protein [Methanobrevibacter sp.]